MGTNQVIRVLVVDDHALHREGTRRILQQHEDFTVIGEADSGERALDMLEETDPDVVLLDVRLPGMNGIEVARRIHQSDPSVKVLMVTAYDDDEYVRGAVLAGAAGYLSKSSSGLELAEAVRAVAAGGSVLEPHILARLVAWGPERMEAPLSLSSREEEVLSLLANGLQNKQMASRLGISPRTVERHCDSIYSKLGVHGRTEAVMRAIGLGLLKAPSA